MENKYFDIGKWFITAILVLSVAGLFTAISYALFDTTRIRPSQERMFKEQIVTTERLVMSQRLQIQDLEKQVADARYAQGRAEVACPLSR